MKTAIVDRDVCIGCGDCAEKYPEVFELRDDKAYVIAPAKSANYDLQEMTDVCPVQAISIAEESAA